MRRTRRKYIGCKLGNESRQSQSVGGKAGVTCHTDKSQQRLLLIRHISRGHSNSIGENKSMDCFICVVKSGTGRSTARQTKEILCLLKFCLFVWCLPTHQALWVISVRRYKTKHDVDEKSKNL